MAGPNRVRSQPFVAVGAIIERGGAILLVKENDPNHPDHGKWNQPAGWLELGENPIEAVEREAQEETGFTFRATHILGIYSLVKEHHRTQYGVAPHAAKILFLGEISENSESVIAEDVSEARWFSPEEIYAMKAEELRDEDIKKEIRDYFAGVRFPLSLVTHTVQMQ